MQSLLDWYDEKGFHVKESWDHELGKMTGPGPLYLFDFQRRILGHAFTPNEKGELPYTTIVYGTIKKSGKSVVESMVGAWAAEAGFPEGSEIYVVANDAEQAQARVFSDIDWHVTQRELAVPTKWRITYPNKTYIQVLAKHYASAAGGRHCVSLFDELWCYTSEAGQRMWAEMTPPPTVPNAFRFIATYAGFENESKLLWDLYEGAWLRGTPVEGLEDIVNMKGEPICRHNGSTFVMWDDMPRYPWQTDKYYDCLPLPENPNDLMVLTEGGWKPAESVSLSDKVCTRNVDGVIEYQNPENVYLAPYDGKLMRMKNRKADLVMTPNHRVLAAYADHTRKVSDILSRPFEYEYRKAKDAKKAQVGWIPGSGDWIVPDLDVVEVGDKKYPATEFIEFMAWYLSEGCVRYRTYVSGKKYASSVFVSQDAEINSDNYKKLVSVCEYLGLKYQCYHNGVGIFDMELARYLSPYGKSFDKYIPRWLLNGASSYQMSVFIDSYVLGDGSYRPNGSFMLYTNSDQMKLDLMEASFKAGFRPRYIGSWSSSPETGRLPVHHISVMESHIGWYASGTKRNNWSEFDAPAGTNIWCLTTPNSNFYVMQNGVCWWTGNSQMLTLRPADFLRMHRNQWVTSAESFIPIEYYDKCVDPELVQLIHLPSEKRAGYNIAVGVDIGTKHDCSAVVGVGYDHVKNRPFLAFHRIWTPQEGENFDIESTVEALIIEAWMKMNVVGVTYDPVQFHRSATTLMQRGINMIEFPQTTGNMTAATQTMYDLLRNGSIDLYHDPELREHIKFSTATYTGRGYRIVKEKHAKYKIDAAVAMAMACYLAISEGMSSVGEELVYEVPFADSSRMKSIPTITQLMEAKLPPQLR